MKPCCEATIQRDGADMPGAECDRVKGHKKRHRETWTGAVIDGEGNAVPYKITIKWGRHAVAQKK